MFIVKRAKEVFIVTRMATYFPPPVARVKSPPPLWYLQGGEERKKDCYSCTYPSSKVEIWILGWVKVSGQIWG